MSELKIDIDGINNKVRPPLDKAKKELESAATSLSYISYSPDYYQFTNRSRVQSVLPQNIRNIKTEVKNINKWLSDISTKFKEADRKSSNSVNSLLGKLDKINLSSNIGKVGSAVIVGVTTQGMAIGQDNITTFAQKGFELAGIIVDRVQDAINSVGAKISAVWDSFYNNILQPGINFFQNCAAKVSNFVTGVINEISNGINKVTDGITSLAKKGWDKLCGMAQSVGDAFNSVGAHISSAWNSFCTDVWPNIWDGIQSFGASVANVVIGLVKGLGQFVESLVDVVVILGTAVGSIGTGIYDGISYLVSSANGTCDEWESATGAMWQWTMGFVAEDHVGDAFADFYKNNVVGQWLDEHAIELCKSDGIITNIASGIGYVAGIIALTIGTLGIGTAVSAGASTMSFATTSAVIATTAATGKYTQESWGEARDSSWEGIKRLYEKGEITEEEYNTFTTIRGMTDDQWAEIEQDYKDGKISKEEFEQIKQIREMPEDWKTFENGWKGLLYGVANGVWEGVQWYVGGKLAGWAIKGQKVATSAVKVGADTAFNALDTPFRTAIDTIASGKTWDQAWEEQGGWESVLTNIGIGLIGSTGGEVFDGIKLNKASKALDANHAFDSLDETTAKKVKDALLDDHKAGKIDLSKITDNELNNTIINKALRVGDGEINEAFKAGLEKATKKINNKKLFNDVDDSLVNQVRSNLMDRHINEEIDLNNMSKEELRNCINTEATNIKNNLSSIIKNSDFNKKNLIEGIVDTVPKDLDDLTKARMVYLKLNQSVTYSDQYFAMNTAKNSYQNELSEIYNRSFDVSNLSTNSIICSNWSNIYADLLQEVGINPKKIEIVQSADVVGAHRWVKMELDDGKILFADATNNINGMTDLANSKLGNSTGGFIITTPEEYAELKQIYGSDAKTFQAINSNKNSTISKIDENIGYSNQQYMKDFEDIINIYGQASSNSISLDNKINIFKDILESNDYSSLDVFVMSRQYTSKFFGSDASVHLYVKGDNAISVIEILTDDNNVKYLYKINDSNINVTDNISNIIKGATKKL